MNLALVVKQSLREAVRGHQVTVLAAMFGIVFGAVGLLVGSFDPGNTDSLRDLLLVATALVVPLVCLMLGNPVVAKKREDGRLRLLLGQPIARQTFVLGSYVANAIVLAAASVLGLAAALAGHAVLGGVAVPAFAGPLAIGTIGLGTAYLGLAVGISAASSTTKWATLNMLGIYLLLVGLWRIVPYFAVFASNGFSFPEGIPAWADLLAGLSPSVAFERLFGFYGVEFATAQSYTSTEFSVAVLLGWTVAVPAVGVWRFVRTDL